jgi:hypothetical protein
MARKPFDQKKKRYIHENFAHVLRPFVVGEIATRVLFFLALSTSPTQLLVKLSITRGSSSALRPREIEQQAVSRMRERERAIPTSSV